MHAFTTPKLIMKLTTVVLSSRPNVSVPMSGTTVRSSPTIPPTKALISISKANCAAFARNPSASAGVVRDGEGATALGDGTAICSCFQRGGVSRYAAPLLIDGNNLLVIGWSWRNTRQEFCNECRSRKLQAGKSGTHLTQAADQRATIKRRWGAGMPR